MTDMKIPKSGGRSDVEQFSYPSTRYSGSKRRLLPWIYEHLKDIRFDTVLDVFGGTASVSLLFKRMGKRIHYNDLLTFNQIIATAIIENSSVTVTEDELATIFLPKTIVYKTVIQDNFRDKYYLRSENRWIDRAVQNIGLVSDKYKRAILMAALFQACLAKRPFNLFHRENLYIRTAKVKRTFYNKTTWERSFEELMNRYVKEYNQAVFSNGKANKVIGGYHAIQVPNGVDLVYLDPPYFSAKASYGSDYLAFYHFLEGLAHYDNWAERLSNNPTGRKRIPSGPPIASFTRKKGISETFKRMLERFTDNVIVLSYQSGGIPTSGRIRSMLEEIGKKEIRIYRKNHRYVLSRRETSELLFVAK